MLHAQNNKTRFFYVLFSDKTWVFDQSERAQGPIYILNEEKNLKYIKSKQERIQNAFYVYTASDITSSMDKLQFGVAPAVVFQKVIFGYENCVFRDRWLFIAWRGGRVREKEDIRLKTVTFSW